MFDKTFLTSFIKATIIEFVTILFFSLVILFLELNELTVLLISYLIISVKAYSFAYIQTQIKREFGYLIGLKCGILSYISYFIIAILLNLKFSGNLIIKLVICIVFGVLGGIIGVNSNKTKL